MSRHLIPLICLAGLLSSALRAQDAEIDAHPLYLQFRVLSGLPWKEPGATRKTVFERIFHEPDKLVRHEILREYLHTVLPVEEFSAAFDECIALEQADFPGTVPEFVMRAWAERAPAFPSPQETGRAWCDLFLPGIFPLGKAPWLFHALPQPRNAHNVSRNGAD